MFKSALKDLTSAVVGSIGGAAHQYNPNASGIGHGSAIGRVLEQGVTNISYRSPILADIAHTVLQSLQHEHQKTLDINSFLNSKTPEAKEFREKVKEKLGDKAKPKEVDAEMKKILSNLAKQLERGDEKEVKKSDDYKEFGKFLEATFPSLKEPEESKNPEHTVPAPIASDGHGGGMSGDISALTEQLHKIEFNTHRTANALEEMALRGGLTGGSGTGGGSPTASGNAGVYIDPYTGLPSVKGTLGGIGAKILNNVLDDKAIDTISNKIRGVFFKDKKDTKAVEPDGRIEPTLDPELSPSTAALNDSVSKTTLDPELSPSTAALNDSVSKTTTTIPAEAPRSPQKATITKDKGQDIAKSVQSVLGGLSLDLDTPTKPAENKEDSTENRREAAAEAKKTSEAQIGVAKETLEEIKKLTKEDKKNGNVSGDKNSIFDSVKNLVGDIMGAGGLKKAGGKILGGLGKLARGAGGAIMGVGRAGAGVLSSALGAAGTAASYIPKLATAAIGGLGTVAANAATGIGAAAPYALAGGYMLGKHVINPLIDKGLSKLTGSETQLGSWLYDKFNPSQDKVDAPTPVVKQNAPSIEPAKKMTVRELDNTQDKLEKLEAKKEEAKNSQQQILINNTASPARSAPAQQSPIILGGNSTRNQESSFDKVQMQNFWARCY